MLNDTSRSRKTTNILLKLLPLLAFVIPITVLYFLDPVVFEKTWKGRIFYTFFLWLISLEIILGWEELQAGKIKKTRSIRTCAFMLSLLLPITYVVISNFYGLNSMITNLALARGIQSTWADVMPLSTEYLVFAALFAIIILLEYGVRGLKLHSISGVFLGLIGVIYSIDNFYPYGRFSPFQFFVPTTASFAANFLNFLGYRTTWGSIAEGMPTLFASGSHGSYSANIAWPCSGIESLLIYAVVILLFLRNSAIPWKQRTVYFVTGGAITYFINVLRIAAIFIIGADISRNAADTFHNYYGQLFSIGWIVFYPLLIMASRAFWSKNEKSPAIRDGLVPTS
ncbi:MAG TPA: exosortase/archaeosortase family protein [candidate division Zixibacteria bacterium]|nr:exosortase/archaeosortase family protein [candidate division Zixibacteria bacterium]